jgi:hypothetical protein
MNRTAPIRVLASLLLLGAGLGFAQTPVAPVPVSAPPVANEEGVTRRAGSIAQVTYSNGLLTVAADNSSLNQILREISRQTGMRISGGVSDERVYGSYGPGTPARILAALLDGTGSNMLLRETASNAPAELILTPRLGGPTPPQAQPSAPENGSPASAFGAGPATAPMWATRPGMGTNGGGAPTPAVDPWQAQQQNQMRLQQQQLIQQQQHGVAQQAPSQ